MKVRFGRRVLREVSSLLFWLACFVLWPLSGVLAPPAGGGWKRELVLIIGVVVLASLFELVGSLFFRVRRWGSIKQLRRTLRDNPRVDVPELLRTVYDQRPALAGVALIDHAVKLLGKHGCTDHTMRMCPPDQADALEPFSRSFEPCSFDETEPDFVELYTAAESAVDSDGPTVGGLRTRPAVPSPFAAIRRRISLKNRWITFVLLSLLLMVALIPVASTWSMDWATGLMLVWIVFILFAPVDSQGEATGKWYLLPQSVCIKLTFDENGSALRLFTRSSSILVAYKLFGRTWKVILADKDTSAIRVATEKEVRLLLRCWIGAHPPPPREHLDSSMS